MADNKKRDTGEPTQERPAREYIEERGKMGPESGEKGGRPTVVDTLPVPPPQPAPPRNGED